MNKKQFLLYTALAVVLSAGCTRLNMEEGEGDYVGGNAGGKILEFVTSVDGKKPGNSRAVLPDIDLLTSGFTVAGYLTPGRVETCEADSVFPNVFDQGTETGPVIQATAKGGKFFLLLPQITIGSGNDTIPSWKKLSYFAWSQSGFAADSGYGIVSAPTVRTDKGMPALGIHLPTAAANQGDIVVAAQTNLTNDYIVSSVNLDFRHILSKLTFKVKTAAGLKVSIKESKLTFAADRLYSKATFQCDGSDTLGYYKPDSYLEALSGTITPSGWAQPEVEGITARLGEMMLVPQAIKQGDIKIALTYTTFVGNTESSRVTKEVALKNTDLRAGKNHLYTLSLSAEEMKVFNVVVDEWKQEEIIIDTKTPLILETTSEGTAEAGVKSKMTINDALNKGWYLAVTTDGEIKDWLKISDAHGVIQNPLPSSVGTTEDWHAYMERNASRYKRTGTIILYSNENKVLAFVDVSQEGKKEPPLKLESTSENWLANVKSKIIIDDEAKDGWTLNVTPSESWLKISDANGNIQTLPLKGSGTTDTLYVYMDRNATKDDRTGSIILRSIEDEELASVGVSQDGQTVNPLTFEKLPNGLSETISIGSVNLPAGVEWELTSDRYYTIDFSLDKNNYSALITGTGPVAFWIRKQANNIIQQSHCAILSWTEGGTSQKLRVPLLKGSTKIINTSPI